MEISTEIQGLNFKGFSFLCHNVFAFVSFVCNQTVLYSMSLTFSNSVNMDIQNINTV